MSCFIKIKRFIWGEEAAPLLVREEPGCGCWGWVKRKICGGGWSSNREEEYPPLRVSPNGYTIPPMRVGPNGYIYAW